MRLTVGSLPAAVYWRRRAIVLGAILSVFLLGWASCSGSDPSSTSKSAAGRDKGANSPSQPVSLSPPSPRSSPSVTATTGASPGTDAVALGAGGDAAPGAAGTCADDELALTPVSEAVSLPAGEETALVLKVKNVASRDCFRDLGADEQELYLLRDSTKIWSSDACSPLRGSSVRKLAPNDEQAFTVIWDGLATADGCTGREPPSAGQYQLFARLGAKVSAPVTLTLT